MVCEVCGSEAIKVRSNPKRGEKSDVRTVQCDECGASYISVAKITHILISGHPVTFDDARRVGVINELQERYMENKKRRFKSGNSI